MTRSTIPDHLYGGLPDPPPGYFRVVMDFSAVRTHLTWEHHALASEVGRHRLHLLGTTEAAYGVLRKLIVPTGTRVNGEHLHEDGRGYLSPLALPNRGPMQLPSTRLQIESGD